jgi:hypothetical protein
LLLFLLLLLLLPLPLPLLLLPLLLLPLLLLPFLLPLLLLLLLLLLLPAAAGFVRRVLLVRQVEQKRGRGHEQVGIAAERADHSARDRGLATAEMSVEQHDGSRHAQRQQQVTE